MMHELYREDPSDNRITNKKISRTIRKLRNKPNKGRIIIFEAENKIIGYSILIPYWSNEYGGDILHIDELYVKPDYRGRGAASSFLKQLRHTPKHRAVALQLEVTPTNTRARKYYQRLGFKKTKNLHLTHII